MASVKMTECLTNPRQLIKLILIVICVCITIYQLSECVSKIVHPPITSYYKFRHNESIKYPSVTVCRRPSYKSDLFPIWGVKPNTLDLLSKDVFNEFRFDLYTLEEFLDNVTYSFRETIALYGYNGSGNSNSPLRFKTSFYPSRGACHTLIPTDMVKAFSINAGYWLYLRHNIKDKTTDMYGLSKSGFEIFIHNEHDVIIEKEGGTVNTDFIYLESAESMRVVLTLQTYKMISTPEQPCLEDPNYSKSKCQEKCMHDKIVEDVGCTAPWLRNIEGDYKQCSDQKSLDRIASMTSHYMTNTYLGNCNCQNPCDNYLYKYQIESRRDADALQSPSSTINIYFSSNLVTELTEVMSYDWNIFLSDVGGSLGFLLGLSVIGFVNVIEEIIKMVFRIKKQKEIERVTDDQESPRISTVSTEMTDVEGQSLKSVMEFVANCDKHQYLQDENEAQENTAENKKC